MTLLSTIKFSDTGFLEWFFKKNNITQPSSWMTPFLDEADNDEEKALELFFKYLEEFDREKNKI